MYRVLAHQSMTSLSLLKLISDYAMTPLRFIFSLLDFLNCGAIRLAVYFIFSHQFDSLINESVN